MSIHPEINQYIRVTERGTNLISHFDLLTCLLWFFRVRVDLKDPQATRPHELAYVTFMRHVTRNANYKCNCLHPEETQDLEFAMAEKLHSWWFSSKGCSSLWANPHVIGIFSEAKNCYIDSAFKVVYKIFTFLFSIHAYVKSGESAKKIPLLFAIILGKFK